MVLQRWWQEGVERKGKGVVRTQGTFFIPPHQGGWEGYYNITSLQGNESYLI